MKKRSNGRIRKCNGCSNGYTKEEKWVLLSKKNIPKRGTTAKDGKLVETQIHFHFKKECLRNTKFRMCELLIPEFYSYNKVDVELMERKSGMKFPPKLISKFKIS